ncbi:MAG: hypothetical protein H7232_08295 [Aeromicrobium sp.]|nr:hypothetical protein [Burkholderiales bacterium]
MLSFPIPLRSLFAVHPDLLALLLQIIHRSIATFLFKQTSQKRDQVATGTGAAGGDRIGTRGRLRPPACREREGAHAVSAIVKAANGHCDIDIEQCPHCGGQLKLIAAIEEPAVIQRILTHLGLATQPPPRAPVVRVDF